MNIEIYIYSGGREGGCRYFFDVTYGDFSKIPILPLTQPLRK